jgi:hypothetical protein
LVNFSLFLRPDCGVQEKNGKLKNARKKTLEIKNNNFFILIFLFLAFFKITVTFFGAKNSGRFLKYRYFFLAPKILGVF